MSRTAGDLSAGRAQVGDRVVEELRAVCGWQQGGQVVGADDDQSQVGAGGERGAHLRGQRGGPGPGDRVHPQVDLVSDGSRGGGEKGARGLLGPLAAHAGRQRITQNTEAQRLPRHLFQRSATVA